MTESLSDGVALGIYEKALVGNQLETDDDWRRFLTQVPEAGFGFVDLSVDETEGRAARLEWDQNRRRMVAVPRKQRPRSVVSACQCIGALAPVAPTPRCVNVPVTC